jgi:hypothetical protein
MPKSFMWSPSLRYLHQNPVRTSPAIHTCYMPRPYHSSWFDHPNNLKPENNILKISTSTTWGHTKIYSNKSWNNKSLLVLLYIVMFLCIHDVHIILYNSFRLRFT